MKGEIEYSLVWPETLRESTAKSSGAGAEAEGELPPLDPVLYARLKDLRTSLAKEHRLPLYGVFSNKTLEDLARIRPTSEEEAMGIKGVGAVKAERFLAPFLELFRVEG